MKILKLRFENLNSLAGEWAIDFTDPEYLSNGIFVITGPTGSGKTTILDAISLALYGRTPRLDKVTKSTNEIMSRHTGRCYSEVIFETNSGRYRCNWSQRRSRNKSNGKLQSSKHEFVDDNNDKVLENKLSKVADLVEKETGMDFDRFTRSILLAQGGFAAFLKASPDERSPILEQITGTGIYSEISMQVHKRTSLEKSKADIMKLAMDNVQILTDEEEKQYSVLIQEKTEEQDQIIKLQKKLNESLQWLDNIEKLETEKALLNKLWKNHLINNENFSHSLNTLKKAQKAININSDYNLLFELRLQQKNDTKILQGYNADLPIRIKNKNEAEKKYSLLGESLNIFENQFKSEIEVIKTVRVIDVKLSGHHKILGGLNNEIEILIKNINSSNAMIECRRRQLIDINTVLQNLNDYFEDNSRDKALISEFAAIEQMFLILTENLKSKKNAVLLNCKAKDKLQKLNKSFDASMKIYEACRKEFEKVNLEYEEICKLLNNELHGVSLSDFRTEQDKLKTTSLLYKEILNITSNIHKTEKEIKGKKELKVKTEGKEQFLETTIDKGKTEIEKLEIKIEGVEVQSKLQSRINDLEEQRKLLEDDKDCPLCGSRHHPYADGNIPIINNIEKQLKDLKTEFRIQTKSLENRKVDFAKYQTKIEEYSKSISEYDLNIKDYLKDYSELSVKLQMTSDYTELSILLPQLNIKLRDDINAIDSKVKIIEQYEKQKSELFDAKNIQERILHKKETELNRARYSKETAKATTGDTEIALTKAEKQYSDYRLDILDCLSKYGEFYISEEKPCEVISELKQRRDIWTENEKEEKNFKNKYSEINIIIEKLTSQYKEQKKNLSEKEIKNIEYSSEIHKLEEERFVLFGRKNSDIEEDSLNMRLKQLNVEREHAAKELNAGLSTVAILNNQKIQLQIIVDKRAGQLIKSEIAFIEKLEVNSFVNENAFINARLSGEKIEQLSKEYNDLINKDTELKTLIKSNEDQRQKEITKDTTVEPVETLNDKLVKVNNDAKEIQESIGSFKNKLKENIECKDSLTDKIEAFAFQKKEYDKWNRLNELIGSHDGKKFRNFAQGITFDLMVNHANKKLLDMTDRYLLQRDKRNPLELNVVDDYQGGEIRTVKNLSGGESFIVSLALALGLSNMSSHNVRVDSLFLDEGFGTLDEEALETALETLGSLQQEGKLIGVISHITALKERIPTQIQISTKPGGKSKITGPGCTKI